MRRSAVLLSWLLVSPGLAAGQVTITEFMAANRRVLLDRDGYSADWIELHNAGAEAVDLGGRYLSNDPERLEMWRLPQATIPPDGFLVVFASGKDRAQEGQPLHTSFRLRSEGGELFLVGSDGVTLLSHLEYGPQLDDISQGFEQAFEAVELLDGRAEGRVLVPKAAVDPAWVQLDFDDSTWTAGRGAFGFQRSTERTLADDLGTDIGDAMRGRNPSAFYRFAFDVRDPASYDLAILRIRYESGCVAYVNGREVARRRAPKNLTFNAEAAVGLEPRDLDRWESFEIPDAPRLLRPGKNVLAVQGMVESANSLEHLVMAEIDAYTVGAQRTDELVFLEAPSPGRPNGTGFARVTPPPVIAPDGALFEGETQATIQGPPDSVVRYTLDGSEPGATSPVYTGPLKFADTSVLKARAYLPGARPSTIAAAPFTELDPELGAFSSDLPLIVVTTFGREVLPKAFVDAHVHAVAPPSGGRVTLADAPDYSGSGAIKLRGSSTLDLPKKSYGLELRGEDGSDNPVSFLGFPPDADWALYGPHNWDQSHIRNALAFELARWMGLDAPRCRFVEVFLNPERRALRRSDYIGLYLLIEKITRGRHRVDVEELTPKHDREPAITGGYILKIDRPGPGDMGFMAGEQRIQFVYPEEREITDPQRRWLLKYFEGFAEALKSTTFDDSGFGYADWIDVENWMDYHFFCEYGKNPDAFTLSTFFYKRRGGKMRMGPVWDHDRTWRTNDEEFWVGRPSRSNEWTGDSRSGWWGLLFRDPAFARAYATRARAHLANELALDRVLAEVERIAAVVEEAEERDRQRWPIIGAGKWYDEIIDLENWIRARDQWLRSELLAMPEFTSSTGALTLPCTLTITQTDEGSTIYYTLDGSDPTLIDGRVSPRASVYSQPIAIAGPMRVRARALVEGAWSKMRQAVFLEHTLTLAISELMYNPGGGGDYEFIELVNIGDAPIDLSGVDIDGPIRFNFSIGNVTKLGPGEHVVVVRDRHQFADRYDTTKMLIAGEFFGRFSNTEGTVRVTGPYGESIASAYYLDTWFPETDGKGRSLESVALEPHLLEQTMWQPSPESGGSPGR